MESCSWLYLLCVTMLACFLTSHAMSLPDPQDTEGLTEDSELSENRRAQWLDTRDLEDEFKDMVYMAMMELINEGKVNNEVIAKTSPVSKRARWQGFCFRRTKNRRFLPYICWKGGKK